MRVTKFLQILTVSFFLILLLGSAWLLCIEEPPEVIPEERRYAHPLPAASDVTKESFVKELEAFLLDAFPQRSRLLGLYGLFMTKGLMIPEVNGIRVEDDALEKRVAFDETLFLENLSVISGYLDTFCQGKQAYFVLIPHRGHYRLRDSSYEDAMRHLREDCRFDTVDIEAELSDASYYRGDIHVRAECYRPLAERLSEAMGCSLTALDQKELAFRQKGTLALQTAFGSYEDDWYRLSDSEGVIGSLTVERESGTEAYYQSGALADPYDLYLGAELTSMTVRIVNPKGDPSRRLVVFRDSFARAFLPYLVKDYGEITVVDLRSPYRLLSAYEPLYADENTDVLIFVSTHTLLTTAF